VVRLVDTELARAIAPLAERVELLTREIDDAGVRNDPRVRSVKEALVGMIQAAGREFDGSGVE